MPPVISIRMMKDLIGLRTTPEKYGTMKSRMMDCVEGPLQCSKGAQMFPTRHRRKTAGNAGQQGKQRGRGAFNGIESLPLPSDSPIVMRGMVPSRVALGKNARPLNE